MPSSFRIAILGGGTAGWICAAYLSQLIRSGRHTVCLIESDDIATVGVGEATLPHLKDFNDQLGIDEADFMRRTQASFKLGIEFRDWGKPGNSYIHPFGAYGQAWSGIEFHHHWLRAHRGGARVAPLEDYNFAITAARAGRFDFPADDVRSVKSTYAYAYHFDAGLYAAYMRAFATARGVVRTEGRVTEVVRVETGDIRALRLQSGEIVEGDLFVDASGFQGLLIDKALNVGWEDWTPWLPCDAAWACPTSLRSDTKASGVADDFTPYTRSIARKAGWQWRIPLQHRTGNGYVFSTAFTSEDDARETLLAHLDGPPDAEPRLLRFKAGRRLKSWQGNCVAIGLASGFLEPLESTSIYLVQAAVTRLLALLPQGSPDPKLAAEFNRQIDVEYERVRDFLILHYHANTREEPLWRHTRNTPIPDSLAAKIALFRTRGYIQTYRDGLFSPASWLAVYNGQDLPAEGYDPMADALPPGVLAQRLDELRSGIAEQVAAMPDHATRVATFCRAPAMAGTA